MSAVVSSVTQTDPEVRKRIPGIGAPQVAVRYSEGGVSDRVHPDRCGGAAWRLWDRYVL